MGVSNGLEIGSMDSETMSVCNKGAIEADAGQKDSDVKTASEIIDRLKANHVINPVSLIPQEIETIVIDDDREPEEGEITNTDDETIANETAEYEAISSEEEFSLRQKIEALEARNLELEKIASISCYTRENFNSYKTLTIEDGPSNHHTDRKKLTRKILPSSNHSKQIISSALPAHIENISSDEEPTIGSENDYYLSNASKYNVGRASHRITKKEKRRKKDKRHKHDDRKSERSTTIKQQPIKAYSYSSGSDNETLLRNRDELIMALNMNEQTRRSTTKSTLYDKLSALQRRPHDDNRKSSSASSSSTKRKRCDSFDTPTREAIKQKSDHSDHLKQKRKKPLPADEEDELHSLEEQELRLMALKSAVLKKHEARKKRLAATQQQHARPYSPTDSVIADECGERSVECIDSDNNNMDISPISSPGGNQCQPMDMELASSNESSKSPVFCRNTIVFDEQYVDWGTSIAVPVPFNATYIEIDESTPMNHRFPNMFGQNQMSTAGFEPVNGEIIDSNATGAGAVNVDSEDELRAQLIEQLQTQNSSNSNSGIETVTMTVVDDGIQTKTNDELSQVDTLEEDCLRSLLLSSKGKKSKANDTQMTSHEIEASLPRVSVKLDNESEWGINDDLPKLTMNLREALKRLKSNQTKAQPIPIAMPEMKATTDTAPVPIMNTKTTKSNSSDVEPPKNKEIFNNETIRTVVATKTAAIATDVPSKRKPTEQLQPKDVPAKQTKQTVGATVVKKKPTPIKSIITKAASTSQPSTAPTLVNTQKKKETETASLSATKATIERPNLLTNLDALRKSTSSPIITTWKPKPVRKLIISLNADSSSDEPDDNDNRENLLPNKTDSNSSINSNNDDPSNAFQLRLDQFLQSVRKNTDATQDTKKSSATVAPAAKAAKKSVLTTSQKQAQTETKVEESKAVRHLPLSSRLEYHRLISRMKLLEKQKEQKSRTAKPTPANQSQTQQASSSPTNKKFPELTVVLLNDRCTQSDKDTASIVEKQKTLIQSTIKSPGISSTNNNSLAKRVLVKNTIENLISEEVKLAALTSSKEITEMAATVTQISNESPEMPSVRKEHPANNLTECESPKTSVTSASISFSDLANKTSKVQTTVLANYEKRYRTHEETYLNDLIKVHRLTSRTNLETRKQQKLEQDLNELRKKVQLTEESLTRQNNLMDNLYPAVAMAERTAINSRTQLLKLETSCNRLGAIVQNTDYKLKCDKQEDIKTKLKQIGLEKLKLKQLDPTAIVTISSRIGLLQANVQKAAAKVVAINNNQQKVCSELSTATADNKSTKDIEKYADAVTNEVLIAIQEVITSTTNTVSAPEAPITAENRTKPTESNEISDMDIPKDQIPTTNPEPEPVKEEPATTEPAINEELIEPTPQQGAQKESGAQIISSEPNNQPKQPHETFFSAEVEISEKQMNDDDTVYGKYLSPLEHLRCDKENVCSSTEQSLDSIICPFDLMGRCEDRQCKYQHLTV